MNPIPLEDNFTDVIGKAQRGLQIGDEQLGAKAGVTTSDIVRVKEGDVDEQVLKKIAPVLNLASNGPGRTCKEGVVSVRA